MRKVNLFIIGAPKAGTSSLHHYLNQHPQVYMSNPKEPAYFCKDLHKESDNYYGDRKYFKFRTLYQYNTLFRGKKEKILGEASVWNLYSKTSAIDIYNYNKAAKIIIMLRNPIDLLYSLHSQLLYDKTEDEKDFLHALSLEKQRKKKKKIPRYVRAPSLLYYSEIVDFKTQIDRYLNIFPRSQIKVILFDDFKRNTLKEYINIINFLGIDKDFIPEFKIINSNKKNISNFINSIMINPDIKIKLVLRWLLPEIVIKKIYMFIRDLNTSYVKRPKLNINKRKKLNMLFLNKVSELNFFLHKNNLIDKNIDLIQLWGFNKIK